VRPIFAAERVALAGLRPVYSTLWVVFGLARTDSYNALLA
jgi:hypothetical protein